jgi:hypothetical protein
LIYSAKLKLDVWNLCFNLQQFSVQLDDILDEMALIYALRLDFLLVIQAVAQLGV